MYIKRYTIAALLLIALTGWFVYAFVTQESVSINFFGTTLPSFSIAIWVIVPLVALYIASVLHMSFYSLLSVMRNRKYKNDHEKIIDAIVDAYLGKENRSNKFKTDRYKLLGAVVDNAIIFPTEELNTTIDNKKIKEVLNLINNIKNSDVVDLRKYSLPASNEFVIQNDRNKYKKGDITAEDILGSKNRYDMSLRKEVYIDFVKKAPLYAIEKYINALTKESLFEILSRINADYDTLEISNDSLIPFFKDLKLTSDDYINASKHLSKGMLPEQRIKLFEMLSNDSDTPVEGYLYTLFDLEMIEPAREILDISQPNEYMRYKAYLSLKECGRHFNINLFT